MEKNKVPITDKYTLMILETSDYFNIGESKLRRIVAENQNLDFVLF